MPTLQIIRAAQCWYRADDYAEIRATMADGAALPEQHAAWLAGAEQREAQALARGMAHRRVPFDLAEFQRFCAHFNVPLVADTRAKFAALKAQEK